MPSDQFPIPKTIEKEAVVDMDKFLSEIEILVEEQLKDTNKPGKMFSLHDININNLTTKDAQIWNKVKKYKPGLITEDDLKSYKQDVFDSNNPSREKFLYLISQILSPLWNMKKK